MTDRYLPASYNQNRNPFHMLNSVQHEAQVELQTTTAVQVNWQNYLMDQLNKLFRNQLWDTMFYVYPIQPLKIK